MRRTKPVEFETITVSGDFDTQIYEHYWSCTLPSEVKYTLKVVIYGDFEQFIIKINSTRN